MIPLDEGTQVATGTKGQYWEGQALPSVFKHALLERYAPQFAGMTASRSEGHRVVFLDGYAGRGRYADGSPGSAERILKMAQTQHRNSRLSWTCFFAEQEPESAAALEAVVTEYSGKDVTATSHRGDVEDLLPRVVTSAAGAPLFLFLDPCGLGLPYTTLTSLLRADRPDVWPPTEILFNFSLEAVRRIGGHVASQNRNEKSVARLDAAVGGSWWQRHFADGVSDAAVQRLVDEFAQMLSRDTTMKIVVTPVRRAPTHKPVYHLIFGTRKDHGVWIFGDSVARAKQTWWDTLEEVETEQDDGTLFSATSTIRPVLETVEARAVPAIAANLAALLQEHASFTVVDHPKDVFGSYYGEVRDRAVRDAVKLLHSQGRTSSTGVGVKRPRDIVVARL